MVVGVFIAPLLMKINQRCLTLCAERERCMSGVYSTEVTSKVFTYTHGLCLLFKSGLSDSF